MSINKKIQRAVSIRKSLGAKAAAYYMRKHGFSIESAVWLLARAK
jgi:hypothetical protein